jgi:serine O-acetyltransferase
MNPGQTIASRERRRIAQSRTDAQPSLWQIFTADMVRYAGTSARPWSWRFLRRLIREAYVHPGLLAVVVYRFGQWASECRTPIVRQCADFTYCCAFNWVRTRLQIELPRSTQIGPGLRIEHFGGILINCQAVAGHNLTLTQGVLLGQTDTGIPTLGDSVTLGVGARIIGGITLGSHVQVGTGAVVTKSFPDYAVIAGVPARLLRLKSDAPAPARVENPSEPPALKGSPAA